MTQVELIRQEIKRLENMDYPCETVEQHIGFHDALDYVIAFLNTLQEQNNEPIKARVKESGKIVEGFFDGKGHFDVPVDHDIFNRYDIDELVFAPLLEQGGEFGKGD